MESRFIATTAVVIFGTGLALAACATTPTSEEDKLLAAGAQRISDADMMTRYVGNTLSGTTPDGAAFHVFITDNGRFAMDYQGERSQGTWRVDPQGRFCSRVGQDEEFCTREYLLNGKIKSINDDGSLAGSARIRSGNPEGL
jgi:hypothetical protein